MNLLSKKRRQTRTETSQSYGLSREEAEKRLRDVGENVLKNGKKIYPIKIFAAQFKDVMVVILLVSTVLSLLMGEVTEAMAIIAIVFLNAVMGFIQEYRTEKTLEALKKMAAPTSKVIRDGVELIIPAKELVPGDAVILEAGDKVPADGVLVKAVGVGADESVLTGESLGVDKHAACVGSLESVRELDGFSQSSLVYMGTVITRGHGLMLIIRTGADSEMGKISDMLGSIEEEKTPLQKRLDELAKYIAAGCVGICLIVSVTGILRGENIFNMIVTGVSLAVAAVPEGLSAVVTISLALAVSRMLKRRALVRKLGAVETLGCADVICSDKTGTLTENKMTVKRVATLNEDFDVSGSGFEKNGGFYLEERLVRALEYPALRAALEISVMCGNARIYTDEEAERASVAAEKGAYCASGEATEIALVIAAAKGGVTSAALSARYEKTDEIPFDSERKCMSVVCRTGNSYRIMTKGACDVILKKCLYAIDCGKKVLLDNRLRARIMRKNDELAATGLRVLGFCYRDCGIVPVSAAAKEEEMIFAGLAGMMDPPRKEVCAAVKACRRAGIRPVMITGDHKITAEAIAREIRLLCDGDLTMTGADIDACSDEQLARAVDKTVVFARVNPGHKLRIVRALRKNGHIVAMTGDGVNDAPAVKEADIGAAMGLNGTDVTKEAASIILTDDNFATLVSSIEEGRIIYKNIRKFIRYLLSCNIGEVMTMFVGMLMGLPVILQPIQILLVNLVTDGLPAVALGLEKGDGSEMSARPRGRNESVFSNGLMSAIVFRGMLIGLSTLGAYAGLYSLTGSYGTAQTGALTALIFCQLVHVFECKSEEKNLLKIKIRDNPQLIGAAAISAAVALASIYIPQMRAIFNTVPLGAKELLTVAAYVAINPIIGGLVNGINFKRVKPSKENYSVKRFFELKK
ncbi:MAG: cation-translocating P-type ATPase [Oscillospiraceae bacterium]|jgi:Ca2+-transporting ATPase|nr:cation-translocating P-type ATPase [Oscillospiraceae bacterium]